MTRPQPPQRRRRRAPTTPPPPVHDLDGMLRRLHLPTVRRLYSELATRAEAEGMSYHTYLETLIAEEIAHRAETRLTRAVRKARFPFLRTIDDFNFTFQTALKLQMLGSYLGPELVTEGKNAILSGPSGTGKSHLCIAIAYRAIQHGYEARFVGADVLIGELSRAASKGRLEAALHGKPWIFSNPIYVKPAPVDAQPRTPASPQQTAPAAQTSVEMAPQPIVPTIKPPGQP